METLAIIGLVLMAVAFSAGWFTRRDYERKLDGMTLGEAIFAKIERETLYPRIVKTFR